MNYIPRCKSFNVSISGMIFYIGCFHAHNRKAHNTCTSFVKTKASNEPAALHKKTKTVILSTTVDANIKRTYIAVCTPNYTALLIALPPPRLRVTALKLYVYVLAFGRMKRKALKWMLNSKNITSEAEQLNSKLSCFAYFQYINF